MEDASKTDQGAWQADIGGEIRDVTFDELRALISDGALLPQDRIRRGNLRWLEAGRVPALAELFRTANIAPVSPEPVIDTGVALRNINAELYKRTEPAESRKSGPNILKGVFALLLVSLFVTYVWMYYRGKAALADGKNIPEVQRVQAGYEKEKKFLEDQVAINEKALAGLETGPKSQFPDVSTAPCYHDTYDQAPVSETGEFRQNPVKTGREFDEGCMERQKEIAKNRALNMEASSKRKRDELMKKRGELESSLQNLDLESSGERGRIINESQNNATRGLFFSTFLPVSLAFSFLGICLVTFVKIREYRARHLE